MSRAVIEGNLINNRITMATCGVSPASRRNLENGRNKNGQPQGMHPKSRVNLDRGRVGNNHAKSVKNREMNSNRETKVKGFTPLS